MSTGELLPSAHGVPPDRLVVVENASLPRGRHLVDTLAGLPDLVALRGSGPALILLGEAGRKVAAKRHPVAARKTAVA